MLDPETMIALSEEEKKIALEGAYSNGGLVGDLKQELEDLHKPFAGMLDTKQDVF